MTPNEHDDHPPVGGTDETVTDGVSAASTTPAEDSGAGSAMEPGSGAAEPGSGSADEDHLDQYLTSGANPFSSVHPTGTGGFPRLQPRQFPPDEPPGEVPEMEPLPDPNALPDPGYPVMAGYPQAFPPGAFPSPFPAGAYSSGFAAEHAAYPVEYSGSSEEDTSTFRIPAGRPWEAAAEHSSPESPDASASSASSASSGEAASASEDAAPDDAPASGPGETTVMRAVSADAGPPAAAQPPAASPPADPPGARFPQAAYQPRYAADPYVAPRSPQSAPPLSPQGSYPDPWSPGREREAPPLASRGGEPGPWTQGAGQARAQQQPAAPAPPPAPAPFPSPPPAPGPTFSPPAPGPTFSPAPTTGPSSEETSLDMRAVPAPETPGAPAPAAPPAPAPDAYGVRAPDLYPEQPPPAVPARETADSLTTEMLLHGRRPLPNAGWRRTLYKATGGLVRIGESNADVRRRDLVNRSRTPVAGGHHRVAVMSLKGGVGKTTTAVGLGSTLASLRGDRVIAMDANPDRGTLSDKVRLETSATVRDLLNERAQVTRYADVRAFTSQGSSRLEILASDRDPAVSVAFSADDYRAVSRVLEHYYSICITDCGTGLLHSAMSGILELADHIVLVSSPSVDGARSASATLDWLEAHGYTDLVRGAVVVLSTIRPRSKSTVDLDRLEQHFAARCRAVVRIPYDAHLEEGAEFEIELLDSETADAYLELAALVGDGFAVPRRLGSQATLGAPFA